MKKKVFFIMSTDDYSGAEAVNINIIDGLREKYEFYWVSRKGNINNFLKEKKIKWVEIKELSVSEIKRVVKENHPDILHATDFKASVICALANTKVCLIEHLHNNSPWLKKLGVNSLAFLYACFKADKILTVSDSVANEYVFSKLVNKKIQCIGNPISVDKVKSMVNKEDYVKKYDICCVARLTEQKNPQKFIEVIKEIKKTIPNIKVVWVGQGELLDECINLAKKLKIQDNLEFVGFKKNPYPYMASSKVFMMTSSWEGYGLVAFEALTLGLPCIVSNVGGLPGIVDNTCGSLCKDKEEFVTEALSLLENEKKLKKISKKAIEKAEKLDNLDTYLQEIEKTYK